MKQQLQNSHCLIETQNNFCTLQHQAFTKSQWHIPPPLLQNLCNQTLIFEIKLSDHNLKDGSQNYTVTHTFTPNCLTAEQQTHKIIPQVNKFAIFRISGIVSQL